MCCYGLQTRNIVHAPFAPTAVRTRGNQCCTTEFELVYKGSMTLQLSETGATGAHQSAAVMSSISDARDPDDALSNILIIYLPHSNGCVFRSGAHQPLLNIHCERVDFTGMTHQRMHTFALGNTPCFGSFVVACGEHPVLVHCYATDCLFVAHE